MWITNKKITLPDATRPFSCKATYFQQPNRVENRGWLGKDIDVLLLFVTPSADWPSYGCHGYCNFEFNNILWRNSNTDPENAEPVLNLSPERNWVRESAWQDRKWKSHREISEIVRLMCLVSSVANVLLKVIQSIKNSS